MGGFEPPMPCGMPVFETGAFNHSATSPYSQSNIFCDFFKNNIRYETWPYGPSAVAHSYSLWARLTVRICKSFMS